MALIVADRVKETTSVTGTGTATLLGASTGYQGFSAIGNLNTTYYCINGQGGAEWEVGLGTYTSSGTTLARNTVLASSNAGALVNFSAGLKDVFCVAPAGKSVLKDIAQVYGAQQTPLKNAATASAGAAYAWDVSAGQVLELTFGAGNITALSSTNRVTGTFYLLRLKQDATGSRTAVWSGFQFPSGVAPTLSTAANAVDLFTFYFDGTNMQCTGIALGVA
jgi:hypothetical protein